MASGDRGDEGKYVKLRSEKRTSLRVQLLILKVRGKDSRGTFFGYATNLSAGGMFIASVNPRKPGEEFEIGFNINGGSRELKCKCEVAWHREYDPKRKQEPGMGIKFVDIDGETRAGIEAFVGKEYNRK